MKKPPASDISFIKWQFWNISKLLKKFNSLLIWLSRNFLLHLLHKNYFSLKATKKTIERLSMSSNGKLSSGSSRSKVSFDSSSISNKNEVMFRDNMAQCSYSNNNNTNLREKPRSWMPCYNAGSHSYMNYSSECDSVKKEISNSNTPRESCALTFEPERQKKKGRSSSLEGIFISHPRNRKPSPTDSVPDSFTTKISSSVFELKRRGYSLINFFTLRILFVDMVIAVGDPLSDFMQVRFFLLSQL